MKLFWGIINGIILLFQIIICGLGTFYKHIPFGAGLGDMVWYLLMYGLLILHIILTITSWKKHYNHFLILTIIFLITTIFICLQATIFRGGEYPWNGEIFYH